MSLIKNDDVLPVKLYIEDWLEYVWLKKDLFERRFSIVSSFFSGWSKASSKLMPERFAGLLQRP